MADPLLEWLNVAIEMESDPDQRTGLQRCRARLRINANSERAWMGAAEDALAGDMRSLRCRVEMRKAEPVKVVLSTEQSS
jgi:hypothetical protein